MVLISLVQLTMIRLFLLSIILLTPQRNLLSADRRQRCPKLPKSLSWSYFEPRYYSNNETLNVNVDRLLEKYCGIKNGTLLFPQDPIKLKLELVVLREEKGRKSEKKKSLKMNLTDFQRCQNIPDDASILPDSTTYDEDSTKTSVFYYINGHYYIRLLECNRDLCIVRSCSRSSKFFTSSSSPRPSRISCLDDGKRSLLRNTQISFFDSCGGFDLSASIDLCSSYQTYHAVRFQVKRVNDTTSTCIEEDEDDTESPRIVSLKNCTRRDECFNRDNVGILRQNVTGLSRNSSYCIFLRNLDPRCPCLFTTTDVVVTTCDVDSTIVNVGHLPIRRSENLSEPIFVTVVTVTLVSSLVFLAWIVIQCSKKHGVVVVGGGGGGGSGSGTGRHRESPSPPSSMKKKPPPRSLTEDDLEHISRLPTQEIVLVYFPDTQRFKELNRKFRDWLITLDVNDVKDIYDEKCSEDVLRDPETWVRTVLGGPEKRIILVCSRLAYECLVKRGDDKFDKSDPHFGLLVRSIQFIEREMRGNYRNLICVRYEDLKICSRKYSSESFNIVPGTEYVLPQHLEDVYRWIHPRNPRPECWSDSKIEVKEFLQTIKNYRHHDENIFTVQFND